MSQSFHRAFTHETLRNPLSSIGVEDLKAADLCTPEAVKLLLHYQRASLAQLREVQKQALIHLDEISNLRDIKENLRVSLAAQRERRHVSWLEISLGVAAGFGIGALTTSASSPLGWALLLLSVVMLLYLRAEKIFPRAKAEKPGSERGNK